MYDILLELPIYKDCDYNDNYYSNGQDHNKYNVTYDKGHNALTFMCGDKENIAYRGVSLNDVKVDSANNDSTIKMNLQAKDQAQSKVIKNSAARCGFKVK